MSEGLVIGVTGKARSGKDSFAGMLAEELFIRTGRRYILMAYATELKKRVQKDFDLSYDQLWGDDKEEEDSRYPKKSGGYWTGREIMQFVGTDCFRAIDDNYWVKELFKVIDDNEFKTVIITDIRFQSEAQPVKDRNGFMIKVVSDREITNTVHNKVHASETAMDEYDGIDFTVDNNGSLDDLRKVATQVVDFILKLKK